ncbi:MAG: TetR/AcrR family transcriptional regulator [Bacteroidota bacterium]
MKNTKQKILNTSRRLFNDMGFGQVTIRMIASELNMSSGNLNYHFKKREDILKALYFEMVEVFDRRIQVLDAPKVSLQFMQANITTSMERMLEYRFFWTDLYFLLKSNPELSAHFTKAKEERINGYKAVFASLIHQNILQKPSFPKEYLFLAHRMIDYSNTWLYASELYDNNKTHDEIIQLASFQLLSMLYPNLTSMGQEEFKSLYSGFISV